MQSASEDLPKLQVLYIDARKIQTFWFKTDVGEVCWAFARQLAESERVSVARKAFEMQPLQPHYGEWAGNLKWHVDDQ